MATPLPQLPQFVETEPVASLAGLLSVIMNSTLTTAKLLNWIPLEWDELIAIALWFNGILGLVTWFQRSQVTPVDKANDRIVQATAMPPGATPPVIE
jgi:hypothetical protein